MFKRNLISFTALGAFVFLAFGSTPDLMEQIQQGVNAGGGSSAGGGGGGNVAACRRYVEHFNSLSCMPESVHQNADDLCPAVLDQSPIDMSSYYDCMVESSKCNGNIPDLSAASSCQMPTM